MTVKNIERRIYVLPRSTVSFSRIQIYITYKISKKKCAERSSILLFSFVFFLMFLYDGNLPSPLLHIHMLAFVNFRLNYFKTFN